MRFSFSTVLLDEKQTTTMAMAMGCQQVRPKYSFFLALHLLAPFSGKQREREKASNYSVCVCVSVRREQRKLDKDKDVNVDVFVVVSRSSL